MKKNYSAAPTLLLQKPLPRPVGALYVWLQDAFSLTDARTDNSLKYRPEPACFTTMTATQINLTNQPERQTRWSHLWPLAFCAVLAACGGGGSDSTSPAASAANPNTNAATTPSAAATSVPAAAALSATSAIPGPGPGNDASCGLNAPAGIQTEIIQRVNALRATGTVCGSVAFPAAGALSFNAALLQAAKGHAADLAANNYFAHNGLDGRTAAERVLASGYSYGLTGENIAGGQPSVEAVMAAWIASPSHCQNIMTPDYRDIAVACVRNDAATYRLYWVMELARPL